MTKINGVREWVELGTASKLLGADGAPGRPMQRGDQLSVTFGVDNQRVHELYFNLEMARALRDELSDIIYDLESLEDDEPDFTAQTAFEFAGVPAAPYIQAKENGQRVPPVHTDTEDGVLYFDTVEEFISFLESPEAAEALSPEFVANLLDGDAES